MAAALAAGVPRHELDAMMRHARRREKRQNMRNRGAIPSDVAAQTNALLSMMNRAAAPPVENNAAAEVENENNEEDEEEALLQAAILASMSVNDNDSTARDKSNSRSRVASDATRQRRAGPTPSVAPQASKRSQKNTAIEAKAKNTAPTSAMHSGGGLMVAGQSVRKPAVEDPPPFRLPKAARNGHSNGTNSEARKKREGEAVAKPARNLADADRVVIIDDELDDDVKLAMELSLMDEQIRKRSSDLGADGVCDDSAVDDPNVAAAVAMSLAREADVSHVGNPPNAFYFEDDEMLAKALSESWNG